MLLALALVSCAPTIRDADAANTLRVVQGQLVLAVQAPVVHAEGKVSGPVVSRYCETGVTEAPERCPVRDDGVTRLYVPTGPTYTERVVLGRVEKPPNGAVFLVEVTGVRTSLRVRLE